MAIPLLHNPTAGGGRGARVLARACRLLAEAGVETEPLSTRAPVDFARTPRLLVLGGDGTHGEVADAVLRAGARTEVGFLPAGTGNDFLLHFGIRTLAQAVARATRWEPQPIDVGRVEGAWGVRHFLSMFGTGFVADVADFANMQLKPLGGAAYPIAVLPVLGRLRAPRTRLVLDGEEVEGPCALVAVCNTSRVGGGMRIAPDASVEDGLFDVFTLETARASRVLALLPALRAGRHVGARDVRHWRVAHVRIETAPPQRLLFDGDVEETTPVEARVLPHALRML